MTPGSGWLERAADRRRVATSHSRTVPSPSPLARVVPSGLNATAFTTVFGAGERAADLPAGGHVPQPHLAVAAAAGQGRAVRAERHREHHAAWPVSGPPICRRVATSHSRTVPSPSLPPLARVLPSGLNATAFTGLAWPVRTAIPGRVAAASIAYRASREGSMRHAATLNSLDVTGSVSPRVSLSMMSRRETATFCARLEDGGLLKGIEDAGGGE